MPLIITRVDAERLMPITPRFSLPFRAAAQRRRYLRC